MFAIGSTPGSTTARSAASTARSASQRATPPAPPSAIVGDVLGGVALLLVVVVLIGCPLLSPEARDETGLIDGERVPLAAALYVSRCCARRRRAAIRSCRWLHSRR
jgi:hypothetical protein